MSIDILSDFTKEEIIQWIRNNARLVTVSRRALMTIRWQLQEDKLRKDYADELKDWKENKPDFGIRDELARKFNSSTDNNERLDLLFKIEPFEKAFRDHIARTNKLEKRQKAVDALYKQIDDMGKI